VTLALAVLAAVWFATTKTVPREFLQFAPHLTTLVVLALASQRLRMPAADGQPYRRGG
jgi:simple sugar transport system permease protein